MKKLVISVMLCLFLTGCYDSVEIDDLAYVVALGIDKGEQKVYKVTFQYAVPLNISAEGGGGENPLTHLTFETDSIQSAIALADSKMAKITDLSHLCLIVFSEDVAKEGIMPLKRDLSETVKAVPDALMAVCKGNAEECLNAVSSPLELNPSRFYEDFFESEVTSAYAVKQTALEFFNGKKDFATPCLSYDNSIKNDGMAVFKDGRLISFFTLEETLIYNLLKGEFTNILIETDKAVFSIDSELSPKYSVDIKEKPEIKIKLTLSGEAKNGTDEIFKNPKTATDNINKALEEKILLFLQKTQEIDCDILTISAHAKRKFLTEQDFSDYKWKDRYKDAKFKITIAFRNTKNTHGGDF